jgi:glycosyltransferase involved in cell wall biosynthesis
MVLASRVVERSDGDIVGAPRPRKRLLYLNYGPQSGVIESLTRAVLRLGGDVTCVDPVRPFLFGRRRMGIPCPNLRSDVVRAVVAAMQTHGRAWKDYYFHTTYAWDRMSQLAGEAIAREKPDVILQAGVLFSPGLHPERPYTLYLDNTRAIAERYPDVPGIPPALPFSSPMRAREQVVYRNARTIFVMSEYVGRSLRDDYGVDPRRILVVGAGPNVTPRPKDPSAREKAFLFVGTEFLRKGGATLLDAFARVRSKHPEVELWIAGGALPSTCRVSDGVRHFGYLSPERTQSLYARASVFVLPTLREPFGLSFLEAMSFGLPCIGTRLYAIPEIVRDGTTGILVPQSDAPALAVAMEALIDNPELAATMGAAGREHLSANFGWEKCARRVVDALGEDPVRQMEAPPESVVQEVDCPPGRVVVRNRVSKAPLSDHVAAQGEDGLRPVETPTT